MSGTLSRDESASEDSVPTSFGGPQYDTGVNSMSAKRYVVIFMGLPARGKTFLAHKLCVLFGWLGHSARVFNIQRFWRDLLCDGQSTPPREEELPRCSTEDGWRSGRSPEAQVRVSPRAEEFDFAINPENRQVYSEALSRCSSRVKKFFGEGGLVAFINDDFCAGDVREEAEKLFAPLADQVMYIEVVRDNSTAFDELKIHSASESYACMSEVDALTDLARRIDVLRRTYTPLGDDKRYIRVLDGRKLEVQACSGYLPSRMVSFLMNLSQRKVNFPIYFSRHGQTTYNMEDRLGGNPELTRQGQLDALYLKEFVGELRCSGAPGSAEMQIWTSQLVRTIRTAEPAEKAYNIKCLRWSSLNEIHAGVCENMTYEEVRQKYPLIYEFRKQNKYSFRYPSGESYQDLVARLEPVIMELENANCIVVVVAHQAILRALLAYFGEASAESSVEVDVPHRTVWRCTATANGTSTLEEVRLDEWFQARGLPAPILET